MKIVIKDIIPGIIQIEAYTRGHKVQYLSTDKKDRAEVLQAYELLRTAERCYKSGFTEEEKKHMKGEEKRELKPMTVIGIDPGAQGGIAVYVPGQNVKRHKMPKENEDLQGLLKYYAECYNCIAFVEKLSLRPDDVVVENGKKNMGKAFRVQKMMANFEHLKAVLEVIGIPFALVHPMSWQSKLGLRIKGEEKKHRKDRYKEEARRLYGGNVTLWNADALLIMHFGRWVLKNDLKWLLQNLPEREHAKLFAPLDE